MSMELTERTVINGAVVTPEILQTLKMMQDEPAYIFETLDSMIREKIMSLDLADIRRQDVELLQVLTGLHHCLMILTQPD